MTIRIAYAVHQYASGGLERCVAHLVNALSDDFSPSIISFCPITADPHWIERSGVTVLSLEKCRGNDPALIYRLMRYLKSESIDVVHSNNWGTLTECSLACRLANVYHIHAEHSQQDRHAVMHRGVNRWVHGSLRRIAFNRCEAVVACADSVRAGIEQHWSFPKNRVTCIANGVQHPKRKGKIDFRSRLGIGHTGHLVGSIGRLVTLKGFDDLLRAVALLRQQKIEITLAIVGEGPGRDQLQQLANELDIDDRVHLLGQQCEIGDFLYDVDVYANSSHTEAMSMSMLEAMSAGCPIVASDVGDARVMLQSEFQCGTVVASRSPDQLADAIANYINRPTLRQSHANSAIKAWQKYYSLEKMTLQFESLYRKTVSPSANSNRQVVA
jgi:glycosyltransferase involved in cell wall biosynthesis